jgi:hypothetical protein
MQPSFEIDPAGNGHVVFTDSATKGSAARRVFFARTIPSP